MLPATGPITLEQVRKELRRAEGTKITLNDPEVRKLANKPSGVIWMSDLRGKGLKFVSWRYQECDWNGHYNGFMDYLQAYDSKDRLVFNTGHGDFNGFYNNGNGNITGDFEEISYFKFAWCRNLHHDGGAWIKIWVKDSNGDEYLICYLKNIYKPLGGMEVIGKGHSRIGTEMFGIPITELKNQTITPILVFIGSRQTELQHNENEDTGIKTFTWHNVKRTEKIHSRVWATLSGSHRNNGRGGYAYIRWIIKASNGTVLYNQVKLDKWTQGDSAGGIGNWKQEAIISSLVGESGGDVIVEISMRSITGGYTAHVWGGKNFLNRICGIESSVGDPNLDLGLEKTNVFTSELKYEGEKLKLIATEGNIGKWEIAEGFIKKGLTRTGFFKRPVFKIQLAFIERNEKRKSYKNTSLYVNDSKAMKFEYEGTTITLKHEERDARFSKDEITVAMKRYNCNEAEAIEHLENSEPVAYYSFDTEELPKEERNEFNSILRKIYETMMKNNGKKEKFKIIF